MLFEVQATVPATTRAVAELLLAVSEGRVGYDNLLVLATSAAARRGAMTVVAGPTPGSYRAEYADQLEPVAVQVTTTSLAVQTWYAGVHTITPCPDGTRITHRVHRVVPEHRGFADGIAELGLRVRMGRDLDRVAAVVTDRLGC
jgi:hypothetical protein